MILENLLVKNLGSLSLDQLDKITEHIKSEFSNKWVRRSLKVMDSSFVLKAITPTTVDRLKDGEENLIHLCLPLVAPLLSKTERIVYLDVSNLPSQSETSVHFDYAWIHALSRRITIPLVTNEKSIFALMNQEGEILTYHLKVGTVYEINNQTLHATSNFGDTDRWHIVADIIDDEAYNYLSKTNKLDKPYANKWCNFHYSEEVRNRFQKLLRLPPTQS